MNVWIYGVYVLRDIPYINTAITKPVYRVSSTLDLDGDN